MMVLLNQNLMLDQAILQRFVFLLALQEKMLFAINGIRMDLVVPFILSYMRMMVVCLVKKHIQLYKLLEILMDGMKKIYLYKD